MNTLSDGIRPFWLPGLNAVSGIPKAGMSEFLSSRNYTVASLGSDGFQVDVFSNRECLEVFAFDFNRFYCAALESIRNACQEVGPPKAAAWNLINAYYAAFYAAHGLLRALGETCSYLEASHLRDIVRARELLSSNESPSPAAGYYHCKYNPTARRIVCDRIKPHRGGAHESFWRIFYSRFLELSRSILSADLDRETAQAVSSKLTDLCNVLSCGGSELGTWLSSVRNKLQYRQAFGVWFPYRNAPRSTPSIRSRIDNWRQTPLLCALVAGSRHELGPFVSACTFLVGSCHETAVDLSDRCPQGRSFLVSGGHRLLNQLERE